MVTPMHRRAPLAIARAAALLAALALPAFAGNYRWTTSGPEPGTIFQIVVDPQNSNRLAAVSGFYGSMVFWSSDRGMTWAQDEQLLVAQRLVPDPENGEVLYAIGSTGAVSGVLKTSNGGAPWTNASSGLPASANLQGLALAPSSPSVLYVAAVGLPGQFFRSSDGGASWSLQSSAFSASYVADVEVDPTNASVIYAAVGYPAGVLKSTDAGVTWSAPGTLPTATRIVIDPSSPSTVYVGTSDSGVSKSTDGGAHWTPANVGIETASIRDIARDPMNP